MFEGPPFQTCWKCQAPQLGVLSIGDRTVNRRCTACGWTVNDLLPPVKKATIYLDQFAISQIYKLRKGELAATSNSFDFWRRADTAIQRAYLLQQAVFPASPIHFKETVVWSSADDLRVAHSMLSGGVQFRRLEEIELEQHVPFAQAFLRQEGPPSLDLKPKDALVGDPDAWLPRFHISVNTDFSRFAEPQRVNRDRGAADLSALTARWATERPTYQQVFERELAALPGANFDGLRDALERAAKAQDAGEYLEVFEATHTPIHTQFVMLKDMFESWGVPADQSNDAVAGLWHWAGLRQLPYHRLSSALFALLARKYAAGQKRPPSSGMLYDFQAVAYFGPYADAMLLDRECAGLVKEMPQDPGHLLRAKVFSLADGDAFIAYLEYLAAGAPDDVRRQADDLYGVTPAT